MKVTPRASWTRPLVTSGVVAALAAFVGAPPAQAQSASAPASASMSAPAPVHVRTDAVTGVKYLSGGVGADEQQALKAEAAVYPFDLVFSRADGAYLVADKVVVRDRDRVVLSVGQAGPILLAKLPPGKYAVEVSVDGKVQQRNVEVPKGAHKQIGWRWGEGTP